MRLVLLAFLVATASSIPKSILSNNCRTAKIQRGEWCDRRSWLFMSSDALEYHLRDAPYNWICAVCGVNLEDEEALVAHLAQQHNHCRTCETNFGSYQQHRIQHHNRCQNCSTEFDSSNELVMVKVSRTLRYDIDSISCSTNKFTSLVLKHVSDVNESLKVQLD